MDTTEKIYQAGLKFLTPLTLEETYSAIAQEAMKLVDSDYVVILLREEKGFRNVFSTNPQSARPKPRKRGNTYQVYKTGKPVILNSKELTSIHPELTSALGSLILMPLSSHGGTVGILSVQSSKDNNFKRSDLDVLRLFAPLASLAIRKTHLYEEINKSLETRDHFISMASHELRTPLTSINGYIQLLYRKFAGQNTSESRWVEGLASESLRLTLLVKELLEINRIKTGQLQFYFKECNLTDIIGRAIRNFEFTNSSRKLLFENQLKSDSDLIIADFDKILQVFNNLLENAAKFSSAEKEVNIKLKEDKNSFIVLIEDKGVGIEAKDLSMVFDGYFRGNTDREGMGLGLYLVKDIMDKHNGSVRIKSKVNKGTSVELKFPKLR